jgi:hypothetical protein
MESITTTQPQAGGRRGAAQAVAVGLAAIEVITAFSIEAPVAAVVFALIFLGIAWWLRDGARGAWIALGVLCAVEVAFLPAYTRDGAADWIIQGAVAVLGVAGLVLLVAELRARR